LGEEKAEEGKSNYSLNYCVEEMVCGFLTNFNELVLVVLPLVAAVDVHNGRNNKI